MGLYEDIGNVKRLWNESSPFSRLGLAVSGFLALGSIATISDIIFHWKGFILDGVGFYNQYIVSLINRFVSFFGGSLSRYWSNYYLLYFLIVAGHIRTVQFYRSTTFYSWGIILIFCFVLLGIVGMIHRSSSEAIILGFEYTSLIALFVLPPFLRKTPAKLKYLLFSPVLFAIAIVLVLGAINSGLTRQV